MLSPGNQPVFNPELMKATQRLRVNKKDTRKDAQKRKLQPESGYVVALIEENQLLKGKLGAIG
jgi:hypothetical protein